MAEDMKNIAKIIKGKTGKEVKTAFVYVIPSEKNLYDEAKNLIENKVNYKVKVFAVNDKKKYDPEGKAGKAKLGKPGIFVE